MATQRGPGRPRNGLGTVRATAQPETETAVQHLARLQATRDANGGYLIPPPAGIEAAQLIEPQDVDARQAGRLARNEPMLTALAHMRALAEIGSSGDLTLFWETWHPLTTSATANPKLNLMPEYQQLAREAGRRHTTLLERAEEETRQHRVVQECRRNLALAEQRLEAERRQHLAPLEAAVKHARALLANAEAALDKEAA